MDQWLKRQISVTKDQEESSTEPKEKRKRDAKTKQRQFDEKYLLYGFTCTSADPPQPQCFFCGEVLANTSMKPAHLSRHLTTKHQGSAGKTEEFYKRRLAEFKTGQSVIKKSASISSKALEASYAVSLLVAKAKKPHTIVEQLILPAASALAEIMIDKKTANTFKTVPLSNNTVSRRIGDMSTNIVEQVVSKMKLAGQFALQLDEMTDVSGEAQLLAFARYKDVADINEHILFCKILPGKTTGEEMFVIIDKFFKENNLQWTSCTHICTDGAAAMTGGVKGLFGHVKKVNADIKWVHCIIHREALASKRVNHELSVVLDDAVKVINFIHSRPLNRRLFQSLCQESGTEHEQLLLHTDVRWLSRGKTLLRVYELRNEVYVFLKEHMHGLAGVFEDAEWVARLAYLADVFTKLNELNLSLQGRESHILNMYDKVNGFTKKLELWLRKCNESDVSCFPLLEAHLATSELPRRTVLKTVQAHLSKLCTEFSQYFQDLDAKSQRLDWVRNPFIESESSKNLPSVLQEQLMDLYSDRGMKMAHAEKTLTEFWCDVEKTFSDLGKRALSELLPFGSTYMCEVSFSALSHIKTKHRNRLDVESSLITAVASMPPDINKLISEKQPQKSH